MAGAALQIDQDDALGLAPARPACRLPPAPACSRSIEAEREPEHAGAADAHQVAAGHAQILDRRRLCRVVQVW